ncbi:S-layer homology domain-containing protein [Microaerobacter geothermalis]|uniref:S-layer homology domain-containing protein n=1 Tax=Microaerobacter geothermalis TaxID=674972 RepID=UPI001F274C2A|nr:S-layer homology domain-containing protein [Microaerobacter geothermalis]MCF6093290.1 S-layer homology domain-containing protein [Microaerobacter geothermalis]
MRGKSDKNHISQPNIIRGGETKVMKKIINTLLVFVLVFAMAVPAFAHGIASDGEKAGMRLKALGVVTGDENGNMNWTNTMTREEFAAVAVRVLGLSAAADAAKGPTQFSDVEANRWSSGVINIATQQGLIKGMGDGTFAPKAPVTYAQAMAIIVRLLGYEPAVTGVWPSNYVVKANELGLLDKVKLLSQEGANGAIQRFEVFTMLDNALAVPKMVRVGYGSDMKYVVSGTEGTTAKTLLDDNLSAENKTVYVVETPAVNDNLEAGEFKDENGDKYTAVEGVNVENFLGKEVKISLNEDGDVVYGEVKTESSDVVKVKEIKSITYDDNSKVSKIKIINADDEEVTYDVFADAKATWNLGVSTLDSLLGNVNTPVSNSEDTTMDLKKEAYDITLILDEDTDGKSKVKFATGLTFADPVVLAADPVINKVSDIVRIKADLVLQSDEDTKVEKYIIVKGEEEITVEDVKEGDVIFVAKNPGSTGSIEDDRYYIIVTDERVTGELEYAKPNLSAATEIKVDGTVYEFSAFATDSDKDLDTAGIGIEDNVELVLDKDGKILDISEKSTNEADDYAVIINAGKETNAYGTTTYKVKLFLASGETVEYVAVDAAETYLTGLETGVGTTLADAKGDLVKFNVNSDGEVDNLVEASLVDANQDVSEDLGTINGVPVKDSVLVFNLTEKDPNKDFKVEVLDWSKVSDATVNVEYTSTKDGEVEVVLFDGASFTGTSDFALVAGKYQVKDGYNLDLFTENGQETLTTVSTSVYGNAGEVVKYTIDAKGKVSNVTAQTAKANTDDVVDTVRSNRIEVGGTWYYYADDMLVFYDKDQDGDEVTVLTKEELYKDMEVKIYTDTVDGVEKVKVIVVTKM